MSSAQIPLDLSHASSSGTDDFVATRAHRAAYDHLTNWPDWSVPVSLIVGPQSSGKTHLSRLFADKIGAVRLEQSDLGAGPDDKAPVIVELDLHQHLDQEALFHALNRWIHGAPSALITARVPPEQWGITLPDLMSRLRLVPMIEIGAPDDISLRQMLVKQIIDRQLMIDEDVINYIMARMERSFLAAAQTIEQLDYIGLARQRRITKILAREVLDQPQAGQVG